MSKTRAAARRLEVLDRDRVEKPWQPWELQLDLAPEGRSGDLVVALEKAVIERDGFRLGPIDVHVAWGERLSIAGPNGSGKTTLIDALARAAASCSRQPPRRPVGRVRRDRPGRAISCGRTSRCSTRSVRRPASRRAKREPCSPNSTSTPRTFSGRRESLSPGERTRAELAVQAARGAGCLVLDEPTNHLDLPAVEELERALGAFDGTLILVTHDRRFLERVGCHSSASISARKRLLEVGPELVDVLEADAEPEQVLGHAVALPAAARLHRRLDAAEARRVRDQPRRRLDLPRVAGDVEREQPAEARIADGLDLRMGLEPARELGGGLGLPPDAELERLQAAEEQPGGIGRGDDPGAVAELAQPLRPSRSRA